MRSKNLLGMFVLSAAASIAYSQAAPPPGWGSPTWYKTQTQNVLNNARQMIEPTLPPSDQEIARAIRYRISASEGIGAFATWEDGRRVVLISAGIVEVSDWLAEAYIFDTELGAEGCFDEYGKYLGEMVILNTDRMNRGLASRATFNPLLYAHQHHGDCSSIEAEDFTSRPDLGQYRAKMIEASIVFLYLHELGHHVLGHTDKLRSGTAQDRSMQRSDEDAADRWAITTALRAKYNLVAAIPAYSFIALTGGNSLEAESRMTHPLGIRRVLTLYDEVIKFYNENPKAWVGPPSLDRMLDALRGDRKTIAKALDSLE